MREPYEILPHTADLRIRAWGKTPEELFRNSLRGMSSVMAESALAKPPTVTREVSIKAPDTATLLIDFLSEALSQSHLRREVYIDVEFPELGQTSLRATLPGVPVEAFEKDVKAVTYHGVEIKETDARYEATVICDI